MQAKAVSWAGQSSRCQVSRPTGPVMPPSEPVPGPLFASQPTGRSFAAELQFAADGTAVEVLGAVVLVLVVGAVGTVGAVGVIGVVGTETLVDGNVGVLVRSGMDVGRVTEGIDAEDAVGADGTEVAVELPVEGTIAGIDAVAGGPVTGMVDVEKPPVGAVRIAVPVGSVGMVRTVLAGRTGWPETTGWTGSAVVPNAGTVSARVAATSWSRERPKAMATPAPRRIAAASAPAMPEERTTRCGVVGRVDVRAPHWRQKS